MTKETKLTVDLFAIAYADDLTERQISTLCDTFFKIIKIVSYDDFGLNPGPRNPNGLLCFVFEKGCSASVIEFIKQQTRIEHWNRSAVSVAWAVDLKHKRIYTHNNPVSYLPPVFIARSMTFPGFSYLKSFLETYRSKPTVQSESSPSNISAPEHSAESGRSTGSSTDDVLEAFNRLHEKLESIYDLLQTMSKQKRESYFVDKRIITIVSGSNNIIGNNNVINNNRSRETNADLSDDTPNVDQTEPE
ncbi:MAG: hypothetical protein AAFY72_08350 [Cyanobacteria bacterium J06649_4]